MLSGRAYLLGGRPILFPFLSGILTYECSTCEAPCCKGAPLAIGKSFELVTIQTAQPRASLFAVPSFHGSNMLALQTPAERCWFLDKKRRCRLEKVLGRESKPAGCRLFPFVKLRSAGEHIVVLPDFTCPLTVAGAPTSQSKTSHDELALEMHHTQVPKSGHPELPAPRDLKWGDAAVLERRIVEEGARHLSAQSYLTYAELQHVLALSALGVQERPDKLARVEGAARRFVGVPEPLSARAVHELVALTGVLRMQASGLPRREMAPVLVALSVLLTAAENMRGGVMSARTAPSILEERLGFLYVLAHLESRPALRTGVSVDKALAAIGTPRPALLSVLRDIEKNGGRTVAEPLEELLRRQPSFAAPLTADAVATLQSLGTVLLRACTWVPA
jgi:Fe-S-cluster containining protein